MQQLVLPRLVRASMRTSPSCRVARVSRRVRSCLLLALAMIVPSLAGAQVIAGDTVRLTIPGREVLRGTLLSSDRTSVRLGLGGSDTLTVAVATVSRAEVLRGRARGGLSSMGKGALAGFAIGAVLGAIPTPTSDQLVRGRGANVVGGGFLGMVAGTLIGGMVGIEAEEHWVDVDTRSLVVHAP